MAQDLKAAEGRVEVPGGRVWDKIGGSGPGLPRVTVHGGPGATHDYPEP